MLLPDPGARQHRQAGILQLPYLHLRVCRIEELESACSTALRVNKHLNVEVEQYVRDLEKASQEAKAWRQHARKLASQLTLLRKEVAGGQGFDEEASLAQLCERQNDVVPEDEQPCSTASLPLQLTDGQSRLLHQLLVRGRVAGWLILPDEVRPGAGGGGQLQGDSGRGQGGGQVLGGTGRGQGGGTGTR